MPHIAIAILAAGASSRMGQPKQLLEYKGKTLLQHAIDTALETSCRPVFVVVQNLGHLPVETQAILELRPLVNQESSRGVSSSICLATEQVLAIDTIDALLFMNADQPQIESACLQRLVASYKSGGIVASRFGGTHGSPAIFDRCYFPELMALTGDRGAKAIIQRNVASIVEVVMEEAILDIDTPSDYASMNQSKLDSN